MNTNAHELSGKLVLWAKVEKLVPGEPQRERGEVLRAALFFVFIRVNWWLKSLVLLLAVLVFHALPPKGGTPNHGDLGAKDRQFFLA